jgi:pentatricopeptide repeat protein
MGGKVSRALALLQVVKDKEMPLDAYVYTAAMEACAKGGDVINTMELFEEMEVQQGIAPTKVTYSVAITACGNAGQWEKALKFLDMMRSKGLSPNLVTYNGAISAVAKAAKQEAGSCGSRGDTSADDSSSSTASSSSKYWQHIENLLEQMRSDGIEPDGFSYSSAISCCGSEGRWQEALALMEEMRHGGPSTRPNRIAYTAAITSCGRSGQVEKAMDLFREMKQDGLSADRVAYNALFSALRVAQRSDVALELWEEMLNGQPSQTILNGPSRGIIAMAQSKGQTTKPDIISVTDAIGALAADDSMEGRIVIDRVLQQAVDRGILLRSNRLDSLWEVDLSGMTLPVARAATRYILRQIKAQVTDCADIKELILITGIGVGRDRSTTLREYIQEILQSDFDPPLESSIPTRAQGTVRVDQSTLASWWSAQK